MLTESRWNEILQAAVDWQYLVVKAGGMARKSDCESWLIKRYSIEAYTARQITNTITSGPIYFYCGRDGTQWQTLTAGRPAPRAEDYPDIDYEVTRL